MYYPMLKHGIDHLCIRRTPMSVLGTSGGPSWAQALVSPRMPLNKNPRYPLYREHSHSLNVSKSYNENGVFTFPFANPFCCLFCNCLALQFPKKAGWPSCAQWPS